MDEGFTSFSSEELSVKRGFSRDEKPTGQTWKTQRFGQTHSKKAISEQVLKT